MTVPVLTVTPAGAAGAYARVQSGAGLGEGGTATPGFGDALSRALGSVVDAGHKADAQSMQAISGGGSASPKPGSSMTAMPVRDSTRAKANAQPGRAASSAASSNT